MLKLATFGKLLQRKCYDILSLQYAFLLIIISSFLFIISLIHFGETWLDWSKNRYEAIFSSFSDNIAGKSFHYQLCQQVPIDVVYTWVNGSDPVFLKNLKALNMNENEAKSVNESFLSRFEDLEELRYSLRSLEMYAPWVHHVYLVTNGQIPYWLNMDHPKLTVVTHKEIFLNQTHLPTFSSPAIESHLHRIPGLSKHFLYLNDDIILGKSVWPEDFVTESRGYKIFVTWNLPDCSTTCTWSWVGDGSCDPPCNIEECSFDGGDCNSSNPYPKYEYEQMNGPLYHSEMEEDIENEIKAVEEYYQMLSRNNSDDLKVNESSRSQRKLLMDKAPTVDLYVKNDSSSKLNVVYLYNEGVKPIDVKKEILTALKNKDEEVDMKNLVQNTNKKWMQTNRILRKMRKNLRKGKPKPGGGSRKYMKVNVRNMSFEANGEELVQLRSLKKSTGNASSKIPFNAMNFNKRINLFHGIETDRVLDMFAESLLYVNRLYNKAFGVSQRKVPAHMPHLINKEIMQELQTRFPIEWRNTSSHKLRSKQDMQFAFSYFYFVISQKIERNAGEIFDEFDTDGSGTWSDREVRTLLTRIYGVPLSYPIVMEFEDFITNCSKSIELPAQDVATPLYERYSDSKLPTITKSLIKHCPLVTDMLKQQFGAVPKYKYEFVKEAHQDVSFKMVTSNLSQVIEGLDKIRRLPRKFICLNNNMDVKHDSRENEIVKAVLQDFYQSLYPKKSSFELSHQYRNRFLHVDDLRSWKRDRDRLNFLLLSVFIVFGLAAFCSACQAEIGSSFRRIRHWFSSHNPGRVVINYSGRRTIAQI